jgi:hypothetical protein
LPLAYGERSGDCLELPAQIRNDVARRFAPGLTPEEMLRPHGGASGRVRRGRRCHAGGGRGGGEGVEEEKADEDDDVPVMVEEEDAEDDACCCLCAGSDD